MRILITGSEGLVGSRLKHRLEQRGDTAIPFDIRRDGTGHAEDICNREILAKAMEGVDGVFHLAAISRVAWGEDRPELCDRVNIDGTRSVVDAMRTAAPGAWLVFASSREVYGDPEVLPIGEDAPHAPVNIYGRSKAEGEVIVQQAIRDGLDAAIIRLSSVYGTLADHHDRAIPALLWRAMQNLPLRLTGSGNRFDFVHVDDSVDGLLLAADKLAAGAGLLPPVHLATGVGTSLGELARLAVEVAGSQSAIEELAPRPFDVGGFIGTTEGAEELLGFRTAIDLATGLRRLKEMIDASGAGFEEAVIPDPDALKQRVTSG